MAIVFISPKAKQQTFMRLAIMMVVMLLILGVLFFFVNFMINQKSGTLPPTSFVPPRVSLNLSIIDSEKVKNLEPFTDLETEFSYVVQDQNGKKIEGNISAATKTDATALLEKSGFTIVSLEQAKVGRSQPFMQY